MTTTEICSEIPFSRSLGGTGCLAMWQWTHSMGSMAANGSVAPAVLLLHGFPTSSHMFRNLIPQLAGDYRVVAPDLPGFGFSDAPDHRSFRYTFDHHGVTNAEERVAPEAIFLDQALLDRPQSAEIRAFLGAIHKG